MKKSILVFTAILTTLTAFGYLSWHSSDSPDEKTGCKKTITKQTPYVHPAYLPKAPNFYYGLGTRFLPIKKTDIMKVTSALELFPKRDQEKIISFQSVNIIIIENDKQTNTQERSNNAELTQAQIKLLRSAPYSTNIKVSSNCLAENWATGVAESSHYSPHLTIVPEKSAYYKKGDKVLIDFFRVNNRNNTYGINTAELSPAKLYFTVTSNGRIKNVHLPHSCGYPKIDQAMKDLIKQAPGAWVPAENAQGQKVDQELVITYGIGGC